MSAAKSREDADVQESLLKPPLALPPADPNTETLITNGQPQNPPSSGRFKHQTKQFFNRIFAPLLKSPSKAPRSSDGFWKKVKWDFLFPWSGYASRGMTIVLLAVMVWAALWSVLRNDMLPYGNAFGLYILVVFSLIAGYLVERIKLAPLLGMLIVGCVMRNVVPINYTKFVDSGWSSALRNIALAVILTRAGLGLDIGAIRRRFWTFVSLATVPTVVMTVFITIVAHYMINFPWLLSGALGFLISAVSPAVIVPIMLYFQDQKIGTVKGLPSLIIAAATICDVICICGNGILLGLALNTDATHSNTTNIMYTVTYNAISGPLSIIVGIGFGLLGGWVLWYFPSGDDGEVTIFRFILLLCGGIFCIFASKAANISGAGALGALAIPLMAGIGWRKRGYTNSINKISSSLKYCWVIFQPLLFGLIGSAVDFKTLIPEKVGMMVGLLFAAHAVQLIAAYISCACFKFSWKENLFLAFSFIPKATIQAAIGGTALDMAIKNKLAPEMIQLGRDTLNCAVLAIIFFAPIGGVTLLLSGGKLLEKEITELPPDEAETIEAVEVKQVHDPEEDDILPDNFAMSPRRRTNSNRYGKRYSLPANLY